MTSATVPVLEYHVNEFRNGVLVLDTSRWIGRPEHYFHLHINGMRLPVLEHTSRTVTVVIEENLVPFLALSGVERVHVSVG